MENEQITSHSEDVQETVVPDAFAEFGITPSTTEEQEEQEEVETETEGEPPAIVEQPNVRKLKFNKGEVEIPEDKWDETMQMGLALPKERERREKYESALTRAAKLAGYENVDTYLTELDTIEQKALQQKTDQLADLKQSMLDEYEGLGYDPAQLDAFIENNPLFQQAKTIVEREQQAQEVQKQQQAEDAKLQGWQDLFTKYPTLAESMDDNGRAEWFTPELEAKLNRGLNPTEAYELMNMTTILQSQRQLAEQAVIQQQRLNKRAPLSAETIPTSETEVPASVRNAFAEFGLDPKEAQKYYKK